MKILTEAIKQGHFIIDKIELNMGSDSVTIENIVDYSINYDKTGTSYFSFTIIGIVPELINAKQRISYIKLFGNLLEFSTGKKVNAIWNIPCDMKMEDMDVDGNTDDVHLNMYVNLSGDMW